MYPRMHPRSGCIVRTSIMSSYAPALDRSFSTVQYILQSSRSYGDQQRDNRDHRNFGCFEHQQSWRLCGSSDMANLEIESAE